MRARTVARLPHRVRFWSRAGVVFVHVPKGGGTTISTALYGRALGHYTVTELDTFGRLFGIAGLPRFAVVRHPVDRAMSAYAFARQGRTAEMGMARPETYRSREFRTFDSFVTEWLVNQPHRSLDPVFRPQCHFVARRGRIAVDHLGRLEDLAPTERWLADAVGIDVDLGRARNQSQRDDVTASPHTLAALRRHYRSDFALLEYS